MEKKEEFEKKAAKDVNRLDALIGVTLSRHADLTEEEWKKRTWA